MNSKKHWDVWIKAHPEFMNALRALPGTSRSLFEHYIKRFGDDYSRSIHPILRVSEMKYLRARCGMTIRQVSSTTGISKTYVSALERGLVVNPSKEYVELLLLVYDMMLKVLPKQALLYAMDAKHRFFIRLEVFQLTLAILLANKFQC